MELLGSYPWSDNSKPQCCSKTTASHTRQAQPASCLLVLRYASGFFECLRHGAGPVEEPAVRFVWRHLHLRHRAERPQEPRPPEENAACVRGVRERVHHARSLHRPHEHAQPGEGLPVHYLLKDLCLQDKPQDTHSQWNLRPRARWAELGSTSNGRRTWLAFSVICVHSGLSAEWMEPELQREVFWGVIELLLVFVSSFLFYFRDCWKHTYKCMFPLCIHTHMHAPTYPTHPHTHTHTHTQRERQRSFMKITLKICDLM